MGASFDFVETAQRMLSRHFVVLSAATLCFFVAMGILVPTLPKYLDAQSMSEAEIGLILGAFSVSAIALRPVVGRELDRRGRKVIIIGGLVVSAAASFSYPLAATIPAVIAVRLLHGVAMASFYPGASTYSADIAPPGRRAEALSYFSMFLFGGQAVGPTIGEFLISNYSFRSAFWASAALATVSLLIALNLVEQSREVLDQRPAGKLLHPAALFPSAVLTLAALSWAATGFVPLYIGVDNSSGAFFLTLSLTVLGMRLFIGRAADRFGRATVIVPGTFVLAAAMATVAAGGGGLGSLVAGAVLFGLGWGALYPGLFSLTIDRVSSSERGSATGTFTTAFDLSFGAGSAMLGLIIDVAGYPAMFATASFAAALAGTAFLAGRRRSEAAHPVIG